MEIEQVPYQVAKTEYVTEEYEVETLEPREVSKEVPYTVQRQVPYEEEVEIAYTTSR